MTTSKAILIPSDDVEVAAHLERVAEGAGARVIELTEGYCENPDHRPMHKRWVSEWEGDKCRTCQRTDQDCDCYT